MRCSKRIRAVQRSITGIGIGDRTVRSSITGIGNRTDINKSISVPVGRLVNIDHRLLWSTPVLGAGGEIAVHSGGRRDGGLVIRVRRVVVPIKGPAGEGKERAARFLPRLPRHSGGGHVELVLRMKGAHGTWGGDGWRRRVVVSP